MSRLRARVSRQSREPLDDRDAVGIVSSDPLLERRRGIALWPAAKVRVTIAAAARICAAAERDVARRSTRRLREPGRRATSSRANVTTIRQRAGRSGEARARSTFICGTLNCSANSTPLMPSGIGRCASLRRGCRPRPEIRRNDGGCTTGPTKATRESRCSSGSPRFVRPRRPRHRIPLNVRRQMPPSACASIAVNAISSGVAVRQQPRAPREPWSLRVERASAARCEPAIVTLAAARRDSRDSGSSMATRRSSSRTSDVAAARGRRRRVPRQRR